MYCPRNSKRLHSTVQQRWKMWNFPSQVLHGTQQLGSVNLISEPDIYSNKIILYRPFYISDENNIDSIRGEMPGLSIVLNNLTSLSPKYEAATVLTFNSERFVYMPNFITSAYYGFYLLNLDKDWNIPIT